MVIATTAPDCTSPNQTGSTNWTLRLCKVLNCNHELTLCVPPPLHEPWFHDNKIKTILQNTRQPENLYLRTIKSLVLGIYPSIWSLHSTITASFLHNLRVGEFDVCWLLDDYAGIYLRDIPAHLPTVFVRHYLFSMQKNFSCRTKGIFRFIKSRYHKITAEHFDKWTTRRSDMVTLGTKESVKFLSSRCPNSLIQYLPTKPASKPNPIHIEQLSKPGRADGRLIAVYLADMRFIRNAEAARWFLSDVLPQIKEKVRKKFHFMFVGREPEPLLNIEKLPHCSSIEFTGFVENLQEILHSAQAAFIPIFGGNGVRLKTITLLGTGLPTISTSDALEGLQNIGDKEVLIANESKAFAAEFDKLLLPEIRRELHINSVRYMNNFLDESKDAKNLSEISNVLACK